jgi:hypothetical protein
MTTKLIYEKLTPIENTNISIWSEISIEAFDIDTKKFIIKHSSSQR